MCVCVCVCVCKQANGFLHGSDVTWPTFGVDLLNYFLHLCLSGVKAESTEYIANLVRVDLAVSTLVKEREGIPEFCVCVREKYGLYIIWKCLCVRELHLGRFGGNNKCC